MNDLTTDTENQTTDIENDDESAVSLDTLDHLFGARLHPVWWGSFRDAPDFADDSTISDAYEELTDRVKGMAGLLWHSDIDAWDAVKAGQVLHDLAREAETLQKLWLRSRRQLRDQKIPLPEAPPRDDSQVKPLLDRFLRRLIDLYPFHLASSLYGTALYARNGDVAELERCVIELEGATLPGWPPSQSRPSDDEPEAFRADLPQTAKLAELLSIAYRSNRVMKHNLAACYLELIARDHDKARSFDMGWTLEGLHETATAGYEALIAAGQAIGVDENDLARFLDADDLDAMSEQGVAVRD